MVRISASPPFEERWSRHGRQYAEDIVAFGQDQWIVKDTGDFIHFQPHQIELLTLLLTRGGVLPTWAIWNRLTAAGRERMQATMPRKFPWSTIIWSEPKKSGKTEIGGLVGLWVTLSEPGINEAFFVANDQDQSLGRGYTRIVDHLNPHSPCYNPVLASMMRTQIRPTSRPSTRLDFLQGDFIRAIPSDYAGEAGANPTISIWDELWAYIGERLTRLWEEFTVVPTRRNSIQFVTTYAGFRDESELLWGLYQRTVRHGVRIHEELEVYESQAGDTVAYWSHTPRMPWQTPEYYEQQRAKLRPDAYRRLHKNQWMRSESSFIDPAWWDALPRAGFRPPPSQEYPVYVAGDASHKRDCTAGAAVGWHRDGYPFLVRHQIWTPQKDQPVIPEDTLGPWIEDVYRDWDVRRIACDPNHMETLLFRLQERGFPVEEYPQTVDGLTSAGDALYTFTRQCKLMLYPAPDLDQHVLSATAKETPRGWRLSKELARKKIDAAVALAMALALARQYGPGDVDSAPMLTFLGSPEYAL